MPITTLFKHEKARRAWEYGDDAISTFGLIMHKFEAIALSKTIKTLDCFSGLIYK